MDGGGMAWFGLCGFGALVKGWDICGTHPALRATLSFACAKKRVPNRDHLCFVLRKNETNRELPPL